MVVQTIRIAPWNSIDERNTLDNVVLMQGNVTVLFMSFIAFWKFLIPFKNYAMSISTSKESNPSIEKSVKIEIESSPVKYSEISGATYIKIKEFNAARNQKKSLKAQKLRPITLVEVITEQPKQIQNIFINKETVS